MESLSQGTSKLECVQMSAACVGVGFEIGPSAEGMKKRSLLVQEKRFLIPLRAFSRFAFEQRMNFIQCQPTVSFVANCREVGLKVT